MQERVYRCHGWFRRGSRQHQLEWGNELGGRGYSQFWEDFMAGSHGGHPGGRGTELTVQVSLQGVGMGNAGHWQGVAPAGAVPLAQARD